MADRISGGDILSEIQRNLEEGMFQIRYSTLVPSVFRVYLHQEDYDPLRAAIPYLTAEIKRALQDHLARLNGGKTHALLKRFGGTKGPGMEYKILGGDWTVEFLPDVEGTLERSEIEVHSELGAPEKAEYGAGELTTRITRKDAVGEKTSRIVPTVQASEGVFAELRYEDQNGPGTFPVTKNMIVIGRGGKEYWVDLKLNTLPDVSREHCRLRRDPDSKAFHLRDVSQFGTTVDGVAVPPGESEVELPKRSRIGLAGIVFLDFEVKE